MRSRFLDVFYSRVDYNDVLKAPAEAILTSVDSCPRMSFSLPHHGRPERWLLLVLALFLQGSGVSAESVSRPPSMPRLIPRTATAGLGVDKKPAVAAGGRLAGVKLRLRQRARRQPPALKPPVLALTRPHAATLGYRRCWPPVPRAGRHPGGRHVSECERDEWPLAFAHVLRPPPVAPVANSKTSSNGPSRLIIPRSSGHPIRPRWSRQQGPRPRPFQTSMSRPRAHPRRRFAPAHQVGTNGRLSSCTGIAPSH